MLTTAEINTRLLEIARVESEPARDILWELERTRDRLYELYLHRLDAQITALKAAPDVLRSELKADFLEHVEQGGDPEVHELVEFRHTSLFQYDKSEALQFVVDNNLPYTRTKVEIDANAFKKACQDGTIDYPAGETVNAPTVAIGKLGHLLILEGEKS